MENSFLSKTYVNKFESERRFCDYDATNSSHAITHIIRNDFLSEPVKANIVMQKLPPLLIMSKLLNTVTDQDVKCNYQIR